jgi:hypothetical protein
MKTKSFSTLACMIVLAALVVLLSSASRAVAQKPVPADGTISYSGRLSNDAGQPVANGMYAFSFTLYDAANGGNLLWSETQSGVAMKEGAFTVQLGSVTPLPKEALISKGWLAVSVRGPGETGFTALAPRQLIDAAVASAPSSPAASAACAHTHFGESWIGTSTGLWSAGLFVQNNKSNGRGIEGNSNTDGIGVYGSSQYGVGVGAYTNSSNAAALDATNYTGFAMFADGNVGQTRSNGGWVKAMARVSGTTITRCYNSQVSDPSTATTVPCGFSSSGSSGTYTVDFGFQVNDRFVTITPEWGGSGIAAAVVDSFPTANQVKVRLSADSAFYIIIY